MNITSSAAPAAIEKFGNRPPRRPPGILPLVLVAGAMELLYLWMLRLNNLKEQVETLIPLILLQGVFYFVSVYFSERVEPRRSYLVFIFGLLRRGGDPPRFLLVFYFHTGGFIRSAVFPPLPVFIR